jgi:transcriptional regulator
MHPDPAFRSNDRELLELLIDQVGFGMIFAQTPDGPRIAHTPVLPTGEGELQFHLSRGNALARHLDGTTALCVINGPDAYVSPRWYAAAGQVPTWNYVAVELEGVVRRMDQDQLVALLEDLSTRHEERLPGADRWTLDALPPARLRQMMSGIIGFELEIQAWRPTLKLSQNKPADERARVADGLEANGSAALAQLMRSLAP